jgi:hypothetical protein
MFSYVAWGKCPRGVLTREDFHAGKFEFQVNGVVVSNMTQYDEFDLLTNDATGYNFPLNADGRVEVQVRVTEKANAGDFLRIGTFILW